MAEVVLERLSKQYVAGGSFAVRDVNLRVCDGELVVLVGPSGCGKTTILRLIAGLEQPTSGDISIGGRNVKGVHPRDRDVAMVFQDYALYPHMTAYENMAFGLRMRKSPRDETDRRVREAAAMLGVSDLLQRKPGALSGGQRQRIALGRAIARVPGAQCLLFDEPLSNLDARMRASMRGEIKALHRRLKATTIYVTHDQEEAMTLGERVIVMAAGRVQQDGPPLEVYRSPRNRFVAGFLGSPSMNFIDGRLIVDGSIATFVEDGPDGARLALSARRAATANAERITLGVRPEHILIAPDAPPEPGALRARVRLIEIPGDHANVHLVTAAGSALIARCGAGVIPSIDASVGLRLEATGLHLFAPGDLGEAVAG